MKDIFGSRAQLEMMAWLVGITIFGNSILFATGCWVDDICKPISDIVFSCICMPGVIFILTLQVFKFTKSQKFAYIRLFFL